MVVNEFEGDTGGGNHVYVIWSVKAFLSKDSVLVPASCRADKPQSALEYAFNTLPSSSSPLLASTQLKPDSKSLGETTTSRP